MSDEKSIEQIAVLLWRHRDRYERDKDISRGHVTDEARDSWMLERVV